uniref:Uncharacterized protein n=1 Tax=Romanomermis culicivorax TaxID=13658 RepID=A0A915L973_ROMCU
MKTRRRPVDNVDHPLRRRPLHRPVDQNLAMKLRDVLDAINLIVAKKFQRKGNCNVLDCRGSN